MNATLDADFDSSLSFLSVDAVTGRHHEKRGKEKSKQDPKSMKNTEGKKTGDRTHPENISGRNSLLDSLEDGLLMIHDKASQETPAKLI